MSRLLLLLVLAALAFTVALPARAGRPGPAGRDPWSAIDDAVGQAIADHAIPGAVVLVNDQGKTVYRKAFGSLSLAPAKEPMTLDTVFDLASLTKVIATTSCVMLLLQDGKIRLNGRVARYWPEFGQNGKERVTIRQLLTHSSGLQAWHNFYPELARPGQGLVQDHATQVLAGIAAMPLQYTPDVRQVYSDLGFITLGEVVRRVSGEPLDVLARERIFEPLGMRDTTFNPGEALRARAAPTEPREGVMLRGQVHDPNAAVMGGVAGHAGLFSTADDLARFARMLLTPDDGPPTADHAALRADDEGRTTDDGRRRTSRGQAPEEEDGAAETYPLRVGVGGLFLGPSSFVGCPLGCPRSGRRRRPSPSSFVHGPSSFPLTPYTIRLMTMPRTPAGLPRRGLGWDIDSGYSGVRGDILPLGSFGHTGFTGTYLWVDPYSQTFIIGLSNRVHPEGKGNPLPLWARVANITGGIVHPQALAPRPQLEPAFLPVLTGLDVLQREEFRPLRGRRVGLITNRSGVNRERVSGIDLLQRAPGVKLIALFAPEHGLRSDVESYVDFCTDEKTGLPVYSLYGAGKFKPAPEQLKGIDTLVFDIQDAGVRYYTYSTTLGLAMEAAAENKIKFVVLDRPNPINGVTVDGPLLESERRGFSAYYRLPVRHGMTLGELAQLYNREFGIGCDLTVVRMQNWRRRMWFDMTGLPWVDPSPNLRSTEEAELYPSIGLLEAANLSVGRGTDTPFERFGAPWIDGTRLARELNARHLPGISFVPIVFKPNASVFRNESCGGVAVGDLDRERFDGCRTAIEILHALVRLYPREARIEATATMFGTDRIPKAILEHQPVSQIVAGYQEDVRKFRHLREQYLLYR